MSSRCRIKISSNKPIEGAIVSKANTTSFIIKVKTDNTGSSGATQFTLPILGVGYNYDVNWGDGTTSSNIRGKITKTYAIAGTYEVKISGTFPRIFFNGTKDRFKLTEINSWGTNAWTSMANAFQGTAFAIKATDTPNLSAVTDTSYMFASANLNGSSLANWTLPNTNVSYMFNGATNIPDISSWNVSNVTSMVNMFNGASTFNQDLSGWCVSSIPSKPTGFDTGATAWTLSRPIWGTCP